MELGAEICCSTPVSVGLGSEAYRFCRPFQWAGPKSAVLSPVSVELGAETCCPEASFSGAGPKPAVPEARFSGTERRNNLLLAPDSAELGAETCCYIASFRRRGKRVLRPVSVGLGAEALLLLAPGSAELGAESCCSDASFSGAERRSLPFLTPDSVGLGSETCCKAPLNPLSAGPARLPTRPWHRPAFGGRNCGRLVANGCQQCRVSSAVARIHGSWRCRGLHNQALASRWTSRCGSRKTNHVPPALPLHAATQVTVPGDRQRRRTQLSARNNQQRVIKMAEKSCRWSVSWPMP